MKLHILIKVSQTKSFAKGLLRCKHCLRPRSTLRIIKKITIRKSLFAWTPTTTVRYTTLKKDKMIFNCVCKSVVNHYDFQWKTNWGWSFLCYRCVITASRSSCTTGHSQSASRSLVCRGSGKGGEEWKLGVKYVVTATSSEYLTNKHLNFCWSVLREFRYFYCNVFRSSVVKGWKIVVILDTVKGVCQGSHSLTTRVFSNRSLVFLQCLGLSSKSMVVLNYINIRKIECEI